MYCTPGSKDEVGNTTEEPFFQFDDTLSIVLTQEMLEQKPIAECKIGNSNKFTKHVNAELADGQPHPTWWTYGEKPHKKGSIDIPNTDNIKTVLPWMKAMYKSLQGEFGVDFKVTLNTIHTLTRSLNVHDKLFL